MFEYLNGNVTFVCPEYIVVDVNGVGYKVMVANPYRYQENKTNKVYVEQIVRDDSQTLYGFFDLDEKKLFLQLNSVSGIGPKSALAILGDNDHSGLTKAITSNDVKYLTKFPGVGKKTAQQIILDLKDKFAKQQMPGQTIISNTETTTADPVLKDGLEALAALGYSERDIAKIQPELAKLKATDAGEYVRAGLKLLH